MKRVFKLNLINKKITSESDVNKKIIIPYLQERKFDYERIEARMNAVGIPDFLIQWKGKFIFVEVKYENNFLTPRQKLWFARFEKDNYLLHYKQGQLFLYDSKGVLEEIKRNQNEN